jgi:hypothetical protein
MIPVWTAATKSGSGLFLNKLPDRNRRRGFFKARDEVRRLAKEAESQVPQSALRNRFLFYVYAKL